MTAKVRFASDRLRGVAVSLVALAWLLGAAAPLPANTGDRDLLRTRYGIGGTNLDNNTNSFPAGGCSVCHGANTGVGALTSYGAAYYNGGAGRSLARLIQIEFDDSDGDFWTNRAELEGRLGTSTRFLPGSGANEPTASVNLTPATAGQTAEPGTTVTYTLTVTNNGTAADTFDVTVAFIAGQTWTTVSTDTVGAQPNQVAGGSSRTFQVSVSIPTGAANLQTSTARVTARSRGNNAILSTSDLTTTAQESLRGDWGIRASPTARGKLLLIRNDDVVIFDGTTISTVQPTTGQAVESAVFTLGSGAATGTSVMGAWRRGTDFAYVWDGTTAVRQVVAINPINPAQPLNPEAVAVADGCVFFALQAFSGGNAVKHVFQVNPANGVATNLTGTGAVAGFELPLTASRATACQAAWVFNQKPAPPGGTDDRRLRFFDGTTPVPVQVDADNTIANPHLAAGRLVYEKVAGGIRQIFLYDSTVASPAPVQLTADTTGSNANPRTDGRHVAWIHSEGSTHNIVLNGGLVFTTDPNTRPAAPGAQPPTLQLHRGQLLWEGANGALFHAGSGIRAIDIRPFTDFDRQWLADGFAAFRATAGADNDNFLFAGTPPSDSGQPLPPLLVVATPGNGQVTLNWDRIVGASSYNVYLALESGLTKDNFASRVGGRRITGVSGPPFTVTGLDNARTYTFVVTTVAGAAEGASSRETSATLTTGMSWTPGVGLAGPFYAVTADPLRPLVAYAGAANGVYKTTDGGLTWTALAGLVGGREIRALAARDDRVYAVTRDGDILVSLDGGASFTITADGADVGESNKSIAIDPLNPSILYAGDFQLLTYDGSAGDSLVIKSTDAGATWRHVPGLAPFFGVGDLRAYAIAIDPSTAGTLYVGGTGEPVARSTDGGTTWSSMGLADPAYDPPNFVYSLALDPGSPSTLFVGTRELEQHGVFKGYGDQHWAQKNAGLPSPLPQINALVVDPNSRNFLQAGTSKAYFFSTNGGESWTGLNAGLPSAAAQRINALAVTAGRRVLAATDAGLFFLDFSLPAKTLTVAKAGGGTGTVLSDPAGINCGATCSATFAAGSSVMLAAVPDGGSIFAGWTGGGCSGTGTCIVTLTDAVSVTATFDALPAGSVAVSVIKLGTGSGTVTSSPAGIDCGLDCTEAYPAGTTVTLTATAAPGSIFSSWSGACSGTAPCTLLLLQTVVVAATFSLVPVDLVTAAVNQAQFSTGQTLLGSVGLNNPGLSMVVDFYLGILIPDGDTIVFFVNGGAGIAFGRLSNLATFQPVAAGVPLATPFAVSVPNFLTYQWTGLEPPGSYVFFLLALRAGAITDGLVTLDEVVRFNLARFAFSP